MSHKVIDKRSKKIEDAIEKLKNKKVRTCQLNLNDEGDESLTIYFTDGASAYVKSSEWLSVDVTEREV
jgi:hypothetical protein